MQQGEAPKVLILHGGALGDCALTLHLAGRIRAAWGEAQVTMVARSPLVRWAQRRRLIAEGNLLDDLGFHHLHEPSVSVPAPLVDLLRGFDRIVSFLGGPEAPVSARLGALTDAEVICIDPRPTDETLRLGRHITEQWLGVLGLCHSISDFDLDSGNRRPRDADCLVHPGSGAIEKCCPIEALEALVDYLLGEGRSVKWIVGPDEMERFGEPYIQRLRRLAPVLYEESVEKAADLARNSDLYIGNDAGLTHVAALAGTPTIAVFGPSDPRVWRPLGPAVKVSAYPDRGVPLASWVRDVMVYAPGD